MAIFTNRCHQHQMQQSRHINCDMNINLSPDNVSYNVFPWDHQRKNSPLPPPPPSPHACEFRSRGGLCVPQDRIEDVFQLFPSFEDNSIMSLDGLLLPPSRDSRLHDSKTDLRVHANYPRSDCREVMRHYWTESTVAKGRRTRPRRPGVSAASKRKPLMGRRQCAHCQTKNTPQWRAGPSGANTLCNACGMRYKSGKLVPEYRPAASPTFNCAVHSNFHKRILRMKYG